MNKVRLSLSLALGSLLLVSCATIGPGVTAPPINIPSIPPINIPSISLPSIPPIVLPSGFPSIPPIVLPSGLSTGGECPYITAAEVTAVMGSTLLSSETSGESCQFTFQSFSGVNVSVATSSDLTVSRMVFGDTAKDTTVAGLPALTGSILGQPAVHVQRGADQLQVLGVLTGTDDATVAKLVQIATTAVGRWP
jgi:hypothetical protein